MLVAWQADVVLQQVDVLNLPTLKSFQRVSVEKLACNRRFLAYLSCKHCKLGSVIAYRCDLPDKVTPFSANDMCLQGIVFLCCWLILHINERIPLLYFVLSYRCPFSNNAYVVLLLLFYLSRYSFIYAITRWYRCDQLKSDTGNNTNTVNNNTPGCTRKKKTCLSKSFTSTAAFIHLIE